MFSKIALVLLLFLGFFWVLLLLKRFEDFNYFFLAEQAFVSRLEHEGRTLLAVALAFFVCQLLEIGELVINLVKSNLHTLWIGGVDGALMASFDADGVSLLFIEVDNTARDDDLRLGNDLVTCLDSVAWSSVMLNMLVLQALVHAHYRLLVVNLISQFLAIRGLERLQLLAFRAVIFNLHLLF